MKVLLKSDQNNGYFTWRPMYFFYHISLNYCYNEMCFIHTLQKKITHFMFSNFFCKNRAVCVIVWKNTVDPGRPTDDNMAHAHCLLDI